MHTRSTSGAVTWLSKLLNPSVQLQFIHKGVLCAGAGLCCVLSVCIVAAWQCVHSPVTDTWSALRLFKCCC